MKITVFYIGKKENKQLQSMIREFEKRISHYVPFELVSLGKPSIQGNQPVALHQEKEGKRVLKSIAQIDLPVLLDVRGKQHTSESFSDFIQQAMNRGIRQLGFVIGGAYGFSEEVYQAVPEKLSLSSMTLSHEVVRLVFLEQLYRAFTILHGEPYHHI